MRVPVTTTVSGTCWARLVLGSSANFQQKQAGNSKKSHFEHAHTYPALCAARAAPSLRAPPKPCYTNQ